MKMDQFVLEMLAKKREHRPESMEAVMRRLEGIQVFDS